MPTREVNSANQTPGFPQSHRPNVNGGRIAFVALLIATVSSAALVWAGLTSQVLPGCGGSTQGTSLLPTGWGGCDQASQSIWGQLRFGSFSVSTALLGVAAYIGAIILLALTSTQSSGFRWLMRFLVCVSLVFALAALRARFWCLYCMAAHAAVLLAWIGAEWAGRTGPLATPRSAKSWLVASFASAAIVITGATGEYMMKRQRAENAAATATESIANTNTAQPPSAAKPSSSAPEPRFTGRYRLGPEHAPVRIVVISDFQCADCQKLDRELLDLANRPGISLSMKHFPFCTDCNPNVPRTLHANACWAARAAEAAGIVGDNAAFWTMQKWLFTRGGGFTEAELRAQVTAMGLATDRFMASFTSRETLDLVKADVAEAMTLGISRTPMVFVNGVECVGWENPGTVTRIATATLESDLPVNPAATDQPPKALDRYLAQWRSARVETPAQPIPRQRGSGIARIEVVGDYQESGTRELCQLLSQLLNEGWSASFVFHHYPADPSCNPAIPRKMNDRACELSTLVLAAGVIGGDIAYWKAHDASLTLSKSDLSSSDLSPLIATATNTNREQLNQSRSAAQQLLAAQIKQSATLGITELPTLFINGKRMARWKGGVDSAALLRAAIAEACNNTKNPPTP